MAVFTTERTARKPHKCGRCLGQIKAGERYLASVATPRDPDLNNPRWWRTRSHLTYKECEYR